MRHFAVVLILTTLLFAVVQVAPSPVNAAGTCADLLFLNDVINDVNEFGKTFPRVDLTRPDQLAVTTVNVTLLRQKYEDRQVPTECLAIQLQVVVMLANANDILSLSFSAGGDRANVQYYADAVGRQQVRFQQQVDKLIKMLPIK